MSVLADLSIPAVQFALGDTLRSVPDIRVEFERIVSHSQEWVMPYLWVSGNVEGFDRVVRDDETVEAATVSNEFDRVALYQFKWSDEVEGMINTIFDRHGTLVEAKGSSQEWDLTVRFEGHAPLSTLQSYFGEVEAGFSVNRVYTPTKPKTTKFHLTPPQQQSLTLALKRGYFDVPRGVMMTELADDLGVSTNALSERLRRATANLVRSTLTVQETDDEE